MRLLLGIALGFVLGLSGYLLSRASSRGEAGDGEGRPAAGGEGGAQELTAPLRRAAHEAVEQAKQAWSEAQQAARQAEQEMLARYYRLRQAPARERR